MQRAGRTTTTMRRLTSLIVAAVLAGGCGSTHSEKAAAERSHQPVTAARSTLPQLIPPPPPPRIKPPLPTSPGNGTHRALPIDRIPTRERVVFLTVDDGAAKDPAFAEMMRTLRVPFSMFLTDSLAGDDYPYFARLQRLGNKVQNHTLSHKRLAGLPYADQRAEICGQQNRLRKVFGERPTLFRPPYGYHDATTLRAAADCGIRATVLWRANVQPGKPGPFAGDHPLRPGDIVLFHFFPKERLEGTTLKKVTEDLLRAITAQGFAVARLEDYV
ncbi:polysaccharide deacetylase family protein [Streptomyces meridianus]|uniref:Polysaccharide deacetylase family protein n=1 Tax=Streptomyces meridianus TaxID=2938945 RepID=A0ABT0X743_9ACTN|nr:polysaccharide deacetylase family protein [Streptomyces meridianus]MCM2578348.1 polysaccharide deacetylase family protein [Streptomyces meridianus]